MSTKNMTKTETVDLGAVAPDAMQFVRKANAETLKGMEIERIATLDAGDFIEGTYLGKGGIVETHDPITGEVRELPTHRFRVAPNVVIRLIESHQIRVSLPPLMDKKVRVIKLGQVNTRKGTRVNDYVIGEVD